ncbi:MarR family transcriptional regulator [Clostridium botulinum]|nr:MarR family transcriptional regulator [Clostridium botulinum]
MDKKTLTLILKLAALSQGLKTKDYRVLLYLMTSLRKGEVIKINQAKIADDLEIAKSDVSRAIKKLVECEILETINSDSGWRVNIQLYPYDEYLVNSKIEDILYHEEDDEYEDD